jgi:hypothetical protein
MTSLLAKTAIAAAIATAAAGAHADFLKFYTGDTSLSIDDGVTHVLPTNGTTVGSDRYSAEGGFLGYDLTGRGLGTLQVWGTNASNPDGTQDDRAIQDLGSARGGLGVDNTQPWVQQNVCTQTFRGNCVRWGTQWVQNGTDPADDSVGAREELRLQFSAPVTLTGIVFLDEDHSTDFGSGHGFDLWVDGLQVLNNAQLSLLVATNLTGSEFRFGTENANTPDDQGFYVGGLRVEAARVPVPGTLALLGIAALGMGAVRRRTAA